MWYVGDTETSHDSEGTEAWVWAWAICSVEDPDDIEYGGDIESLVDCLCEHVGDRVYFHNLKFDGEFIMLHLLNTGWAWIPDDAKQAPRCFKTIITEDRNVYKIALSPHGKGYVSIVDSYKVLTLSVAATAKAYGVGECKGDLDYDKYRYEQSKRERDNRKNQRVVSIKEVQLSATIEENDVLTKAKMATKFLADGDKVKVSIRFRGRQITHSEIGLKVMQNFAERCAEVSNVERRPTMDGRHMIMILAPKAAKASFAEKKAAREARDAKDNTQE